MTGCLLTAIDSIGVVLERRSAGCRRPASACLVSSGQVDVHALLGQRQRRHEDDEQHEQHVDERRDVHVRAGVRHFALDDLLRAEVLVRVRHGYLPPAGGCRLRVLRLGDEADVLDPGLPQVVHRLHDRAVRARPVSPLISTTLLLLVLEDGLDRGRPTRSCRHLDAVDLELVLRDRSATTV